MFIGEGQGAPGEQAEGKVGADSVAGLVAGHEVEPARGLGDEVQRGHEHQRVALHAAPQDAHREAEVVEVRQPQQHVRATHSVPGRHLPSLRLKEHLRSAVCSDILALALLCLLYFSESPWVSPSASPLPCWLMTRLSCKLSITNDALFVEAVNKAASPPPCAKLDSMEMVGPHLLMEGACITAV